ncbi:hypothetical protein PR003_g3043 [Phytophthora rubi]|uniref:Uncharacterized protein n=1 Tax=Phytophthora rubi TaxID=129364 RepID=A0A6A3LLF6_9STRA|nr:hypothetical protein PR002_g12634 [Phytophthora rubi]KAE9049811.1 hypothetical protein PR001_g2955 [Phytophthora rubi]KAE9355031.1 hypothetical protein PR003_g3043 [Phytophthora rubi]
MEGGYAERNTEGENGEVEVEYAYPEGYDANSIADYQYQPQEGEGDDTSHQPQEYSEYYSQESYGGYYASQEGQATNGVYHQYQSSYDPVAEGYDTSAEYYATEDEYGAGQQEYAEEAQEAWNYNTEEHQLYLDQLTAEQTTGYYYDEGGNLVGAPESPTNVFTQESYWQGSNNTPCSGNPMTREGSPQDETDTEGLGDTDSAPMAGPETVATPDGKTPRKKKVDKNGRATSPSRKKKTKKERIQKRQEILEKEEEERIKAQEITEAAGAGSNAPGDGATKAPTLSKKKTGFVDREKAKFQMKMRVVKAIKRTRMPVQIRILPTTRKRLSPMDQYFGSSSVECVLSDIFWAAIKGDIGRVKHLVEIEGESPTDSKLDPWNLHQTPLHWAAKGGSVPVINYLLAAGASPRSLDENGSLPLHLACWAGHVDASIVLLRASDVKDLYVQDYDAAMCPLDWVNVRGHTKLLKAIEKYQDSLWLPKFVEDLIRGIVRYKIKIFKDPPKKLVKAAAKDADETKVDPAPSAHPATVDATNSTDKSTESQAKDTAIKDSPAKKSLLKRAKTEKVDRKLAKEDRPESLKSLV